MTSQSFAHEFRTLCIRPGAFVSLGALESFRQDRALHARTCQLRRQRVQVHLQSVSPGSPLSSGEGDHASDDRNKLELDAVLGSRERRRRMNHVERRQHKFQGRGPRQGRDMRLCIVTRERVNRFDLWRVVRIATGARAPDEPAAIIAIEQGNGRSVYIKRDVELIRKAQKRNVFSKALRVNVDSSVYDELVRLTELWSARQPNGTSQ